MDTVDKKIELAHTEGILDCVRLIESIGPPDRPMFEWLVTSQAQWAFKQRVLDALLGLAEREPSLAPPTADAEGTT